MNDLENFIEILEKIDSIVWGPVLIILLVGTGLYLSVMLKGIQLRKMKHAVELVSGKFDDPHEEGEITHFQALSAALSATIGTGNIAGVATAIAAGGPGAVFWMWVSALVGMATKFTSCMLSLKFRTIDEEGRASGGPMYYLERGVGSKWLGIMFALFTAITCFGTGNMVQVNAIADGIDNMIKIPGAIGSIPMTRIVTGIVTAIFVALVIIGGIKRIGAVASKVVPLMAVIYSVGAITVLILNADKVLEAFQLIFYYAFNPTAAVGGFAGSVVAQTIRFGVARGVFSNESGLGTAPIAHGATKTREPVREGLVAMLGPFIDTIIVCTMTALAIVSTGVWNSGVSGLDLTASAFGAKLSFGQEIVSISIIFFAFTTIIGWSYYGERSFAYLFGEKWVWTYHLIYVCCVPLGAIFKLSLVWTISDIFNAFMVLPNLIGLLLLSPIVLRETKDYFARDMGRIPRD